MAWLIPRRGFSQGRVGCRFQHSFPFSGSSRLLVRCLVLGQGPPWGFRRRRADGAVKRCFIDSLAAFASQSRVHRVGHPGSAPPLRWECVLASPCGNFLAVAGLLTAAVGSHTSRVDCWAGARPTSMAAIAIRAGPRRGDWAQMPGTQADRQATARHVGQRSPARRPNLSPTGPAHTPSG